MAEYIEREALITAIYTDTQHLQYFDESFADLLMIDIEEAPTADVAPVRHCQWVLVEKGPDRCIYRCPWCGRIMATMFVESEVAKQFPYCHCGAKMDRGE